MCVVRNLVTDAIGYGGRTTTATVPTNGDEVELELADTGSLREQTRQGILAPCAGEGLWSHHRDRWNRFTSPPHRGTRPTRNPPGTRPTRNPAGRTD